MEVLQMWFNFQRKIHCYNTQGTLKTSSTANKINFRIKEETREVNLNGDDKRFWLGRLVDINDGKSNNSTSLNPEFFAEKFELNDDL